MLNVITGTQSVGVNGLSYFIPRKEGKCTTEAKSTLDFSKYLEILLINGTVDTKMQLRSRAWDHRGIWWMFILYLGSFPMDIKNK